ncbi:hypothetical protein [Labilibaculum antarcticum]|nr:hypothetical protein [Labilibaculum antarcticum]
MLRKGIIAVTEALFYALMGFSVAQIKFFYAQMNTSAVQMALLAYF